MVIGIKYGRSGNSESRGRRTLTSVNDTETASSREPMEESQALLLQTFPSNAHWKLFVKHYVFQPYSSMHPKDFNRSCYFFLDMTFIVL